MLVLLATIAATPPVMVPPPSPMRTAVRDMATVPAIILDVEVRGGALLWSGTMRVSPRVQASYTSSKSDAPAGICPPQRWYGSGERDALRLTVSFVNPGSAPRYVVNASWTRPAGDGCDGAQDTRTVALTESVDIGQRDATVSGDGGLTVRLRQR